MWEIHVTPTEADILPICRNGKKLNTLEEFEIYKQTNKQTKYCTKNTRLHDKVQFSSRYFKINPLLRQNRSTLSNSKHNPADDNIKLNFNLIQCSLFT